MAAGMMRRKKDHSVRRRQGRWVGQAVQMRAPCKQRGQERLPEEGQEEDTEKIELYGRAGCGGASEPNHPTEAKWIATLARLLRFVDDGFTLSKINFENSFGFCVNRQFYRSKHAAQAQNVFRHLVRRAEEIGMKVNTEKRQ